MAITIISNLTSGYFYPSANPINVTVDSNNSGKCNFRYICDLYINGTKVFTDKLFPDPLTGYGFFQISRVLQDYIQTFISKTSYTSVINAAATSTTPSSAFTFYLRFGEEYDNSVTCDGDIKQYLNLSTSNSAYVFESAIDYEDFPTFNSTTEHVIGTYSNTTDKFLTNTQRNIEVTYNDPYSLDFITPNNITTAYQVRLTIYLNDNTTATYYYSQNIGTRRRFRLACGPLDINRVAGTPLIAPQVKYYTIQLIWSYPSGISTIRIPISELFTFTVKPPKTYRTRIGFVGLKGGIEHFTFYHRNRTTYDIERKNYNKTLQTNYSGVWKYEVGDRGDTTYAVNAQERHTVATFCDVETSEWLYEMWLSPQVFTYRRPDLYSFRAFVDGLYVKFWCEDDHGFEAGDTLFGFSDNEDLVDAFTVTSVSGNIVDCSLLNSIYGANLDVCDCGYLQKDEVWSILPIIISDSQIEVKQKLGRPIEYTLAYSTAYQKTTLR